MAMNQKRPLLATPVADKKPKPSAKVKFQEAKAESGSCCSGESSGSSSELQEDTNS